LLPRAALILAGLGAACAFSALAGSAAETPVLRGADAFGDWRSDAPGTRRLIRATGLPAVDSGPPRVAVSEVVAAPDGAMPQVPPGFTVTRLVTGLENPRRIRVAPNGDVFIAETRPARVRVLRLDDHGAVTSQQVFAEGLPGAFGMAFYPGGAHPQWLYVATLNSVVRFAYRDGDLAARSAPETVVARLSETTAGHSTRDLAFTDHGRTLLVSVGSASNVAESMPRLDAGQLAAHEQQYGRGAAWGSELLRADVLAFNVDKPGAARIYASGIRNCVGMTVYSSTGDLWCAVNERDLLGDDLVPDYVSRVRPGAFYGWPWYYLGDHQDPRHRDARTDLAGKMTVPDVLLQAHSAALGVVEYRGGRGQAAFPPGYDGDLFVTLHGSWNRSQRTGYKLVRVPTRNGVPSGEYVDFMTGFVLNERQVWGRPVGVAVGRDGALLVTDDGGNCVWRISADRSTR
jgi:glucose/arabinose dehydrogenase